MLHIPHSNDFRKLTWTGKVANLICPNGHIIDLRDYRIYKNGMVTPNVTCGHICTFNEFVKLNDWSKD